MRWFRLSKKYGLTISLTPLIWLHWQKFFCVIIGGSGISKALFSIDTAHLSSLQPIHSLFWIRFTKSTSEVNQSVTR